MPEYPLRSKGMKGSLSVIPHLMRNPDSLFTGFPLEPALEFRNRGREWQLIEINNFFYRTLMTMNRETEYSTFAHSRPDVSGLRGFCLFIF